MADDSLIVGVGAALGAAVTGAVQAYRGRKAQTETTSPEGILKRLSAVESQVQTIRFEIAGKVDRLSESVDEFAALASATSIQLAAMLPAIQRQLDDLKTDVRTIRDKE